MEYKILEGYSTSNVSHAKMNDLEKKVAEVLSARGKTLGGVTCNTEFKNPLTTFGDLKFLILHVISENTKFKN